jgi:hypothetical protein
MTMLPRLEAEESMLTSLRVSVGSRGTRESAGPVMRAWERASDSGASRRRKPLSKSELAGMGIGYRVATPAKGAADG